MSKEYLEALEKLDHTLCLNNNEGYLKFGISDVDCQSVGEMVRCLNKVENALQRLEAIDNANPSEALKGVEWFIEMNKNSIEVTKENNYPMFDLEERRKALDTIKQALLKAQEPKHYLKWEDLDFTRDEKVMNVKMGDVTYKMVYYKIWSCIVKLYFNNEEMPITLSNRRQFFNDLRLEKVVEE